MAVLGFRTEAHHNEHIHYTLLLTQYNNRNVNI